MVEHSLGKGEVGSSILPMGTTSFVFVFARGATGEYSC
ncbi:protein of unknown function [Pararobbsia alpina]